MSDPFLHHLRLDQIRDGERMDMTADEAERQAIATRLRIPKIDRLDAHAVLSRSDDKVRAKGRLVAALDQSCVVTGDPVSAHVDEPFDFMFIREPDANPDEEIELGEEDCDVVFHDGSTIDLGAAIADTLALCLDPYPRSAGAEAALREAGVMTEDQASPFAALAQLKFGDNNET
jgi:uncharacterized metal-binding protein YceD (DUF177 family)